MTIHDVMVIHNPDRSYKKGPDVEATAILCDYAQVNNGKLYLTGAAANLVGTASAAPPHPISVAVGILITIP